MLLLLWRKKAQFFQPLYLIILSKHNLQLDCLVSHHLPPRNLSQYSCSAKIPQPSHQLQLSPLNTHHYSLLKASSSLRQFPKPITAFSVTGSPVAAYSPLGVMLLVWRRKIIILFWIRVWAPQNSQHKVCLVHLSANPRQIKLMMVKMLYF